MVAVISKRIGFSFDELNELTIQGLIDVSRMYAGGSKGQDGKKKRKATAADIYRFMGGPPPIQKDKL